MPKKTEEAEKPKRAKKTAELTPELLASRIEASPEGAEAVKLLVQAAMSGRQDLLEAALRKLMATALVEPPKKRGRSKAPEPVAAVPKLTPAQIEAEDAKIHAADLIRNLGQPVQASEVLRDFIQAQLQPSYRTGQRVWSFKPTWKGRPLTSIRETWQAQLQAAGIDTSRLLLQVQQGQLVVNLNGFGRMG